MGKKERPRHSAARQKRADAKLARGLQRVPVSLKTLSPVEPVEPVESASAVRKATPAPLAPVDVPSASADSAPVASLMPDVTEHLEEVVPATHTGEGAEKPVVADKAHAPEHSEPTPPAAEQHDHTLIGVGAVSAPMPDVSAKKEEGAVNVPLELETPSVATPMPVSPVAEPIAAMLATLARDVADMLMQDADFIRLIRGAQGPAGPAGAEGKSGASPSVREVSDSIMREAEFLRATHGIPGVPGQRGEDGKSGKDGAQGPAGPAGAEGKSGKDGSSPATFVYVAAGAALGMGIVSAIITLVMFFASR